MENPIKQIKLNQLEYNLNRDPQVYRRVKNKPFNLKVFLSGTGNASVKLSVAGEVMAEGNVSLPGVFEANPVFDTAGSRVGTITVSKDGESFESFVRFDVMDRAKVG